jgi:hypothetical protein
MRGPVAIGLVAAAASAGCGRRGLGSCDDDLRGMYTSGSERSPERWMILDRGDALEAYAVFPDADGPGSHGVVAAPRELELHRGSGATIAGMVHRRYMRRAERCEARTEVHVVRCAGDATGDMIELVLADPAPPLEFAPCTWPAPGASRVVRWRRE